MSSEAPSSPRLGRSAAGSLVLRAATVGLAFLSSLVLARIMGAEGYGVYAYVLSWLGLLAFPAVLGLDRLVVREVAAGATRGEWGLVRGVVRWSIGTAGAASLAVGLLAALAVLLLAGEGDVGPVFHVALLSLPLGVLVLVLQAATRGLNHVVAGQIPDSLVRPGLFLLLVAAVWLAVGERFGPVHAAALWSAVSIVALVVAARLLRRRTPSEWVAAEPVYRPGAWIRSALPLLLVTGLFVINSRTDTIMLGAMRGPESAGIYFVANRGAELIATVLVVVNMPLAPAVAGLFASGDREGLQRTVTRSARMVLLGAVPAAIALVVLGEWVLGLFGPAFPRGRTALTILCVGQLVNSAAGSVGLILNMTGHERDTVLGVGVSAIANVALNAVLIPIWGMEGAAVATAASMIVWNVLLAVRVHRRLGLHTTALGVPRRRRAPPGR